MRRILAFCLALCAASAQIPHPQPGGAGMGHIHLNVRDAEAARAFWLALGATPSKLGRMDLMRFPDLIVLLTAAENAGQGSEGSAVGHIGLRVKDLAASRARWEKAGLAIDRTASQAPTQLFLTGPGGIRVEVSEDRSLATPIANHHLHFYTADVNATRAWYVNTFGARPGKRGKFEAADLPGVNLTFAEGAGLPTKGRTLDHIGFEINGLEAFCKKLEAAGVKFDVPYRKVPSLNLGLAFLTDPWGAYIELTEGLDKL